MLLQIVAFLPLAWAIFIGLWVNHLNQDPNPPIGLHVLLVIPVFLTLAVAMPVRWVRFAGTTMLSLFVVGGIFQLGLWWLPSMIMALIVTYFTSRTSASGSTNAA